MPIAEIVGVRVAISYEAALGIDSGFCRRAGTLTIHKVILVFIATGLPVVVRSCDPVSFWQYRSPKLVPVTDITGAVADVILEITESKES